MSFVLLSGSHHPLSISRSKAGAARNLLLSYGIAGKTQTQVVIGSIHPGLGRSGRNCKIQR